MAPRVLVVDDEPALVDILVEILTDAGYDASGAGDGLAALAMVERERPALVLSDVQMPRLDGIGLAARLRQRSIPVVLMSAVRWPHQMTDVAFLAKPFDLDELLVTVDAALAALAPQEPQPKSVGRHAAPAASDGPQGSGPAELSRAARRPPSDAPAAYYRAASR